MNKIYMDHEATNPLHPEVLDAMLPFFKENYGNPLSLYEPGMIAREAIEKIVKDKHQLRIQDDVEFRQGDIVVHDNAVAYRLDFDTRVTLTVIFDRDGNYLSFFDNHH